MSEATRHVYVEAAFWWPEAVAGRARRFNFSTEAAHRFERGVDPSSTVEHIERVTSLILEICGGEAGPIDDHQVNMPQSPSVCLRVARASKVIGMPLSQAQCADALRRLGLAPQEEDGLLTVQAPPHRFDLRTTDSAVVWFRIRVRRFRQKHVPGQNTQEAYRYNPSREGHSTS